MAKRSTSLSRSTARMPENTFLAPMEKEFQKIWKQFHECIEDSWSCYGSDNENLVLSFKHVGDLFVAEMDTSKAGFKNGLSADPDQVMPALIQAFQKAGIKARITNNERVQASQPISGRVTIDLHDRHSRLQRHRRFRQAGQYLDFPLLRVELSASQAGVEKLRAANQEYLVVRATSIVELDFKEAKKLANQVLGKEGGEAAMRTMLERLMHSAYRKSTPRTKPS